MEYKIRTEMDKGEKENFEKIAESKHYKIIKAKDNEIIFKRFGFNREGNKRCMTLIIENAINEFPEFMALLMKFNEIK